MPPLRKTPRETAGLIWQPEILPMLYAMATMVNPNARAVSKYPLPLAASHPTSIAVPHPRVTRTDVPINSATYFFMVSTLPSIYFSVIIFLFYSIANHAMENMNSCCPEGFLYTFRTFFRYQIRPHHSHFKRKKRSCNRQDKRR